MLHIRSVYHTVRDGKLTRLQLENPFLWANYLELVSGGVLGL